jgi:hypothetical protein
LDLLLLLEEGIPLSGPIGSGRIEKRLVVRLRGLAGGNEKDGWGSIHAVQRATHHQHHHIHTTDERKLMVNSVYNIPTMTGRSCENGTSTPNNTNPEKLWFLSI